MIKSLDFIAWPTQDMRRAVAFYRDVLGLEVTSNWEDKWTEFDIHGVTLALMNPAVANIPFAPVKGGSLALAVEDVAAAVAKLQAQGVEFHGPVIDTGVCRMASFSDPDGNALMFHHRYAPEA